LPVISPTSAASLSLTVREEMVEVVPFAVELRGGDPVISERLRA